VDDSRTRIGGILQARSLLLFSLAAGPDRPGIAATIFTALGQARLNAQFIVESVDPEGTAHVQFCVAASDEARVREVLVGVSERLHARNGPTRRVGLLAVYGPDFRERPGIAGQMFGALAAAGINILAVSTSISTVSCVVEEDLHEQALATLHSVFALP